MSDSARIPARGLIIALFLGLLGIHQSAVAIERIGLVKTSNPLATAIRQGLEVSLEPGAEIFEGDIIVTDANGGVGITFSDGAVLTLGSGGKIIIENFMFKPDEGRVSFLTRVTKGTVAFISGAIGRIAPGSVQFKTPTATLGLRGTKILIEVND